MRSRGLHLEAVLAEEPAAVRTFLDELESIAMRIGRGQYRMSRDDSEDVLVETFEKLWRNDKEALRRWRGQGTLSAYLAVVVNSFCLMRMRRKKRESHEISTDALDAFPGRSAAQPIEHEEVQQVFRGALERLSEKDRLLIRLRYLEERDYGVIVAETGGSAGAARKAVHTALKRLREEMRRMAPEFFSVEESRRSG